MAVIHISEAEASSLSPILAKVRAGDSVVISSGNESFSIVRVDPLATATPRRSFSEALRLAEERNSDITLDGQFGNDLEAIIRQHQSEPLIDPWE